MNSLVMNVGLVENPSSRFPINDASIDKGPPLCFVVLYWIERYLLLKI